MQGERAPPPEPEPRPEPEPEKAQQSGDSTVDGWQGAGGDAAVGATQIGDTRIAAPRASGPGAEIAPLAPFDGGRYEIRREIATGGMGRIFEATDHQNHRLVAIKTLIRMEQAFVDRFVREARITARLQHPSIIPLYDAGRWPSGAPFFTMKLVGGRSLREVMDETRSPKDRLALLPHLVAVTEALAYAHQEQIIHRDLKPSNILVGSFGETVVIDWGLAKDRRDPHDRDPTVSAPVPPASSDRLTVAGTTLGTPCYMPPEQARGDEVDERADVYALGAVLYHAFAAVPPYTADTTQEILERVRTEPPEPLERRAVDLPSDLVAIVNKAMARDPAERYPTAKPMAEDLKRFATGRLVSAYSYSLAALVSRWIARHRAAVVVAVVLLAFLSAGTVFSVRRIVEERERADASNQIAQAERKTALTQRDAAEQLVEFIIGELKDRLEPLGKLDLLAGVGGKVEGYYRAVADPTTPEVAILRRRATALGTLAEVENQRHNGAAAKSLYDESLKLYQSAALLEPSTAARGDLLEEKLRFAYFQRNQEGGAALDPATEVAAGAEALAGLEPTSPRWPTLIARARVLLANERRSRRDFDGALDEARAAVAAASRLSELEPEADTGRRELGAAYTMLGRMESAKGLFDTGSFEKSIEVGAKRLDRSPDDPSAAADLGKSYLYAALARRNLGDFEGALFRMRRCRDLRDALSRRDPSNVEWKRSLAEAYDSLCSVEQRANRFAEAIADCRRSVAIGQEVVARDPDSQQAQDSLLLAYERLGWVLKDRGKLDEALPHFQEARAIAEKFCARAPEDRDWQDRLAESRMLIAQTYALMGRSESSLTEYRAEIEILERSEESLSPHSQQNLLESRTDVGLMELKRGRAPEGYRRVAAALEQLARLPKVSLEDEALFERLAEGCAKLAGGIAGGAFSYSGAPELVEGAIARLEPLRVSGHSPARRLAYLAQARRALRKPRQARPSDGDQGPRPATGP